MKFGRELQQKLYPEWRFYYIDYDKLKLMLKDRTSPGKSFTETDEAKFVEALETEMKKVRNAGNLSLVKLMAGL